MIAGVAAGLAHYLSVDPVIVRLVFVILAFTGGGILAYIIAWIVIPEAEEGEDVAPRTSNSTSMLFGLVLVGIGGLLLVNQVVPGFSWRFVAPAVLIGFGVLLLVRREGAR